MKLLINLKLHRIWIPLKIFKAIEKDNKIISVK